MHTAARFRMPCGILPVTSAYHQAEEREDVEDSCQRTSEEDGRDGEEAAEERDQPRLPTGPSISRSIGYELAAPTKPGNGPPIRNRNEYTWAASRTNAARKRWRKSGTRPIAIATSHATNTATTATIAHKTSQMR